MRNFIHQVSIKVDRSNWTEMRDSLMAMGYLPDVTDTENHGHSPFLTTRIFRGASSFFHWSETAPNWIGELTGIKQTQNDLFLAIAAMSEGSTIYPGEYVKIGNNKDILKVIESAPANQFKLSDGKEGHFFVPIDYLSKATLVEILDHFQSSTEQKQHKQEVTSTELLPRNEHNAERIMAINGAIFRRINRNELLPVEWVDELFSLLYDRTVREEA